MTEVESIAPKRVLITLGEVIKRLGVSRTTVWRLVKSGDFAPEYRVSAGKSHFDEAELNAWIDSRRVSL
ncbi:helix-turn-helix domain-containing protein [Paraburkholderia strydomiana]|uniref:helix-turn-helix transcriptional regulator n=1 Tax=Paraburkholderia strydomiana TaxID=1245417 RepID=UPI0038BAC6F7